MGEPAYEPSGPSGQSLSQSLRHDATRSVNFAGTHLHTCMGKGAIESNRSCQEHGPFDVVERKLGHSENTPHDGYQLVSPLDCQSRGNSSSPGCVLKLTQDRTLVFLIHPQLSKGWAMLSIR